MAVAMADCLAALDHGVLFAGAFIAVLGLVMALVTAARGGDNGAERRDDRCSEDKDENAGGKP